MATKSDKKLTYESKTVKWEIFPELCKSCGLCIVKCPVKCLSYDQTENEYLGMPTIKNDVEKCLGDKTCQNICPECAIRVERK